MNTREGCKWQLTPDADWIQLTTSSGAGPARIAFNVLPSAQPGDRRATLRADGTTASVVQLANQCEGCVMADLVTLDARFQAAVAAIDEGDVVGLERFLASYPALVTDRLESPGAWLRDQVGRALEGFFARPFLLWFVAEDPVRRGALAANIAVVARLIIDAARREAASSLQEQLDYTLRLVSWSWIARQCGVQIALIDVLLDAGASPDGNPNAALVNGNFEAAEHLVRRGAPLTLAAALCLGRWTDADRLLPTANDGQKQFGFVLAALNGKAEALRYMIRAGTNVNRPSDVLYSHGTPLHHAVSSGSLEAVQVLVEAGADLGATDLAWHGTPLGWAKHYIGDAKEKDAKAYSDIAAYLLGKDAANESSA